MPFVVCGGFCSSHEVHFINFIQKLCGKQKKICCKTLSVFMWAPHLWPLRRGSDLCLARAPVSEVSLQSPLPNNHTRPLSSPYEGNKIQFKPDPNWFLWPLCVRFCVWAMVKKTHTHKENSVMSAWGQSISKRVRQTEVGGNAKKSRERQNKRS